MQQNYNHAWTIIQNNSYASIFYFLFFIFLHKSPADPGVYFSAGLEDCKAIVGEAAELVCKLSADCEGVWSKDGDEV